MKRHIFLLAAFLFCGALASARTAAEFLEQYQTLYDAKQHEAAIIPLQKAVDMGDAEAENKLGYSYSNGIGVEKDEKKAVFWYEKAANQGNPNAQFNVGVCYFNGFGVTLDKTESTYWMEKAYKNGSRDALNFWTRNKMWQKK